MCVERKVTGIDFDGGYATYFMGASLRECEPFHITLICSDAYDFSLRGKVTMLNSINWNADCAGFCDLPGSKFSLAHRVFEMTWWWVCRDSACTGCGIRLNGDCKSSFV